VGCEQSTQKEPPRPTITRQVTESYAKPFQSAVSKTAAVIREEEVFDRIETTKASVVAVLNVVKRVLLEFRRDFFRNSEGRIEPAGWYNGFAKVACQLCRLSRSCRSQDAIDVGCVRSIFMSSYY
jgi:hypothetical protein